MARKRFGDGLALRQTITDLALRQIVALRQIRDFGPAADSNFMALRQTSLIPKPSTLNLAHDLAQLLNSKHERNSGLGTPLWMTNPKASKLRPGHVSC